MILTVVNLRGQDGQTVRRSVVQRRRHDESSLYSNACANSAPSYRIIFYVWASLDIRLQPKKPAGLKKRCHGDWAFKSPPGTINVLHQIAINTAARRDAPSLFLSRILRP